MYLTVIKDYTIESSVSIFENKRKQQIDIRVNPKIYKTSTNNAVAEALCDMNFNETVLQWFVKSIANMITKKALTISCININ